MDSPPSGRDPDLDPGGILSTPCHHRTISGTTYRSPSRSPSPADYYPPLLSSPSLASSLGLSNGHSPLRKQLSSHGDDAASFGSSSGRLGLARRLSLLAEHITSGQGVDEVAVSVEVERLEKALAGSASPPPHLKHHRRPMSLDMRTRSDVGGGIASSFSSPPQSLFRSRFSDLSMSWLKEREREREREAEEEEREKKEQEEPAKGGLSIKQAKKIIAESTKLNEELAQVVNNLKARQEESEHIHSLLIERAERAAQRIIFLQNRISYLEEELQENDDELQHLRISLKAVEIQLPPHPDQELQRGIAAFKQDYLALKRKRVNRSSIASIASFDSTSVAESTAQLDTPPRM
ncbi:hypothetical protein S7711_02503 [Stachybotrys chartarum IBT 7711]|uniref:Uncharacterized protein n=1 Tax=Stachybotrys chartarum (strain CBS 109288 / IBT 7711) TaxID=1280523 RepID=A0A084B586_STACB|nr:hypothetical protein S7711_02503 [Stachybotrys chartarum IBT 7711]KFA50569.1 hypothetical protein S40293_03100 [Stachybotrys chartarum IBT 40293]KFA79801.1 hypothetical protein S40288_00689 [Stachybotrys chartarum IBT 40288]